MPNPDQIRRTVEKYVSVESQQQLRIILNWTELIVGRDSNLQFLNTIAQRIHAFTEELVDAREENIADTAFFTNNQEYLEQIQNLNIFIKALGIETTTHENFADTIIFYNSVRLAILCAVEAQTVH